MQCVKCGEVRLSSEFPQRTSRACTHPPFWCLECLINNVKNGKCPECQAPLTPLEIQKLESYFILVTQDDKFNPPLVTGGDTSEQGFITVTLLTGENTRIAYNGKSSVEWLQGQVQEALHIPVRHQKLFYKNQDVKVYNKNGKPLSLAESQLTPGSMVQCMRLMYAIGRNSGLNKVVFELGWGYPATGRDYLDGSCMVYSKQKLLFPIDYSNWKVSSTGEDLYHSVSLCKKWDPRPLCEYSVTSAGKSQAVIMCCLIRNDEGGWTVLAIGKPSSGNVKVYAGIQETIAGLFASGSL